MKTSPEASEPYHEGMRRLQDRYGSRRLADRLDQQLARTAFSEEDCAFITSAPMFMLATADARGRPDCSYKGGDPGFVRVTGPGELAFPSYDGNGMFRSLGNLSLNPAVALLFIDFTTPRRLRVNGSVSINFADPLLDCYPEAQLVVRVRAHLIFQNCPRYIHRMVLAERSPYVPRAGQPTPVPAWKQLEAFRDVLPGHNPALDTSHSSSN
jgi:predicted pyridoxine 5'-phosphate oxidase superfamily flavin-nucleotide-binding protein